MVLRTLLEILATVILTVMILNEEKISDWEQEQIKKIKKYFKKES